MRIALAVGFMAGLAYTVAAIAMEWALTQGAFLRVLQESGWALPLILAFGLLAVSAMTLVGASPKAWEDIFESFYLGSSGTPARVWTSRGLTTLLGRVALSLFDLSGAVIEFGMGIGKKISARFRLHYEERQVLIAALFSATLSVAFESPFFAALFAIELFASNNTVVRSSAIVASLAGFGVSALFQGRILSESPQYSSLKTELFAALFSSQPNLEGAISFLLMSLQCAAVGALVWALLYIFVKLSHWCSKTFDRFFSSGNLLRVGITGLLISLVYVTAFGGEVDIARLSDARIWEDLSWVRFSTSSVVIVLVFYFCRLAIGLAGWGSVGLFVPILTLGAIAGFLFHQLSGSDNVAIVMMAGAVVAGASFFGTPLAMSALLLESSGDMRVWWFGSIAIGVSVLLAKVLRTENFRELKLFARGLEIYKGRVVSLLRNVLVSEVMTREVQTLPIEATVQQLREAATRSMSNVLAITNAEGKYLGLLSLEHLPDAVRNVLRLESDSKTAEAIGAILQIRDLVDATSPVTSPTDDVVATLQKFSRHPCVAVVDDGGYLCGVLFESTIYARYRKELGKAFT